MTLQSIAEQIAAELPGWMFRVQSCALSSEAWVSPDLNSPDCPADIRSDPAHWDSYMDRNEVEIRPGGLDSAVEALALSLAAARRDLALWRASP